MKKFILALFLMCMVSCAETPERGMVYDKYYTPSHKYYTRVNNITYMHRRPERFTLRLRKDSIEFNVSVNKSMYNEANLGDSLYRNLEDGKWAIKEQKK